MQSSSAPNNRFTPLSALKMPLGKFVLEKVTPAGNKETSAATGSNAIPIHGNKKSFGKKLLPINRAQSARPGPLAPRPASKLSPQAKSFVPPSNRTIALKRAISTPLPHPSPSMDQFPALPLPVLPVPT